MPAGDRRAAPSPARVLRTTGVGRQRCRSLRARVREQSVSVVRVDGGASPVVSLLHAA